MGSRIQKKFNNLFIGMGRHDRSWFFGQANHLHTGDGIDVSEVDSMHRPGVGTVTEGVPIDSITQGDYIWHVKGNLLLRYPIAGGASSSSPITTPTGAASNLTLISIIETSQSAGEAGYLMVLVDTMSDNNCRVMSRALTSLQNDEMGNVIEFADITVNIPKTGHFESSRTEDTGEVDEDDNELYEQIMYTPLGPNGQRTPSGSDTHYSGMASDSFGDDGNFIITDIKPVGPDQWVWQIGSSLGNEFSLNQCVIFETNGNPAQPWGPAPTEPGGPGTRPVFTPIEWFGSSRTTINYNSDPQTWEYCTDGDFLNATTALAEFTNSNGEVSRLNLTDDLNFLPNTTQYNGLDGPRYVERYLKAYPCKIQSGHFPMPFQMYHDASITRGSIEFDQYATGLGHTSAGTVTLSSTTYIDDLDGNRVEKFSVSNMKTAHGAGVMANFSSGSGLFNDFHDFHRQTFRLNLFDEVQMAGEIDSGHNVFDFYDMASTPENSVSLIYSADWGIFKATHEYSPLIGRYLPTSTPDIADFISQGHIYSDDTLNGALDIRLVLNGQGYYPNDNEALKSGGDEYWPSNGDWEDWSGLNKEEFFNGVRDKLWFNGEPKVVYPNKALSVVYNGNGPRKIIVSCKPKFGDSGSPNSWIKYDSMLLQCGIVENSTSGGGGGINIDLSEANTTDNAPHAETIYFRNNHFNDNELVNASMHASFTELTEDMMMGFTVGAAEWGHACDTVTIDDLEEKESIFTAITERDLDPGSSTSPRDWPVFFYDGLALIDNDDINCSISPWYATIRDENFKFSIKKSYRSDLGVDHDADAGANGNWHGYNDFRNQPDWVTDFETDEAYGLGSNIEVEDRLDVRPLSGRDIHREFNPHFEYPTLLIEPSQYPWSDTTSAVINTVKDYPDTIATWDIDANLGTPQYPVLTFSPNGTDDENSAFSVNHICFPTPFSWTGSGNNSEYIFNYGNTMIVDQDEDTAKIRHWTTSFTTATAWGNAPAGERDEIVVTTTPTSAITVTTEQFNSAFVTMEVTEVEGTEANFLQDFSVQYRYALIYDGNQETPLSMLNVPEGDTAKDIEKYTIKFTFNWATMSHRITHITLYRKYVKTDGTGDAEFKLIFTQKLRPYTQHAQTVVNPLSGMSLPTFSFEDYNKEGPAYSAVNGVSETYFNLSLNYGLSTAIDNYLFVSDAQVPGTNEDFSTYIFRSLPKRFSQFDWATSYQTLPEEPHALTSFNGRIYAFTTTRILKINPYTLDIEDDYQGVTCLNRNTVFTTEFGMCFADHDNIYLHDGTRPTVISAPIAKMSLWDHITYAKPGGWKNRKKKSIFVTYSSKQNSFLIFFSTFDYESSENISGHWCWAFNIISKRWDLLKSPGEVKGVMTANTINNELSNDVILMLANDEIKVFCGHPINKKQWKWISKALNAGQDTIEKRFKNIKILSDGAEASLQDKIMLGWEGFSTLIQPTTITDTVLSDQTTLTECYSSVKKFRSLNIALVDMPGTVNVDSLSLVFRRKRIK